MDIIRAAERHASSVAVRAGGLAIRYGDLLDSSRRLAARIAPLLPPRGAGARDGPRIGVYAEPGFGYVAASWAAWLSGGVCVPVAPAHPPAEVEYVLKDSGAAAVLAPEGAAGKLQDAAARAGAALHVWDPALFAAAVPEASVADGSDGSSASPRADSHASAGTSTSSSTTDADAGALIIYTSGTTGRPKGALHTHGSLRAQAGGLVDAWGWRASDRILHALPLHHIHGIVNAALCAHLAGAGVDFAASFQPNAMWRRLIKEEGISVLMAVPTMYSYLLSSYDRMSEADQAAARAAAARLRLAVSGSAACPLPVLERWRALSGQVLLERYGMTETGMILSNPYQGERRPGFVGLPLPGVGVRVASDPDAPRGAEAAAGSTGELRVAGPALFREYWGRPDATRDAFDADGYFKTGDVVSLEGAPPYFKILGRASVDIIKSAAFKVSALEVEGALLEHPDVQECAVVGVPDDVVGETITALVRLNDGASIGGGDDAAAALRTFCAERLPKYKVPGAWRVLDAPLQRNAMGKVNKKDLVKALVAEKESGGGKA